MLQKIFRQCLKFKPAVIKIVTMAQKPEDNLTVLGLIPYAQKHKQKIIALCMGETGRISRVMASHLGGFLSFVALDTGAQSAPGQLTVQEMREITKLIEGNKPFKLPASENQPENYILIGNPVNRAFRRSCIMPLWHDLILRGHYSAFCVYDLAAAWRVSEEWISAAPV